MANLGKILLSLLVGGAFLYLAFRDVAFADLLAALSQIDWHWLCVAIAVSLLLQLCRVWRWQLELSPLAHVPFPRLWVITSVAYMAINLLPARMGEIVRPWLLARRSAVTFTNVVGNLIIEKTLDSIVIALYILVGLATASNLPTAIRQGALVPIGLASAFVTLVLLLWWRGDAFVERWVVRFLPERMGDRLKRAVRSVLDGMLILPDTRLLAGVFLLSLGLWFLPILSSYIMLLAFDLDAPFSAAVIVFIFIGFGTALPNLPGMVGTFQAACILALALFGIEKPTALAYGLVLNAVQLFTLVGQGLVALPLAGIRLQDLARAQDEAAQEGPN